LQIVNPERFKYRPKHLDVRASKEQPLVSLHKWPRTTVHGYNLNDPIKNVMSFVECRAKCQKLLTCRFFVFSDEKKTCYLKLGAPSKHIQQNATGSAMGPRYADTTCGTYVLARMQVHNETLKEAVEKVAAKPKCAVNIPPLEGHAALDTFPVTENTKIYLVTVIHPGTKLARHMLLRTDATYCRWQVLKSNSWGARSRNWRERLEGKSCAIGKGCIVEAEEGNAARGLENASVSTAGNDHASFNVECFSPSKSYKKYRPAAITPAQFTLKDGVGLLLIKQSDGWHGHCTAFHVSGDIWPRIPTSGSLWVTSAHCFQEEFDLPKNMKLRLGYEAKECQTNRANSDYPEMGDPVKQTTEISVKKVWFRGSMNSAGCLDFAVFETPNVAGMVSCLSGGNRQSDEEHAMLFHHSFGLPKMIAAFKHEDKFSATDLMAKYQDVQLDNAYNFFYEADMGRAGSGSPLINRETNQVIGVHIGEATSVLRRACPWHKLMEHYNEMSFDEGDASIRVGYNQNTGKDEAWLYTDSWTSYFFPRKLNMQKIDDPADLFYIIGHYAHEMAGTGLASMGIKAESTLVQQIDPAFLNDLLRNSVQPEANDPGRKYCCRLHESGPPKSVGSFDECLDGANEAQASPSYPILLDDKECETPAPTAAPTAKPTPKPSPHCVIPPITFPLKFKILFWKVNLCPQIHHIADFVGKLGIRTTAACIAAGASAAALCEVLPGSFLDPLADICASGMLYFAEVCEMVLAVDGVVGAQAVLALFACSDHPCANG